MALRQIRDGAMSRHRASVAYGIPRTTLIDRLHGRVADDATSGPSSILTPAEEKTLVNYIDLHILFYFMNCRFLGMGKK